MYWVLGGIGAAIGILTLPSNVNSFRDSNWTSWRKIYFLIGSAAAAFDIFFYFLLPITTNAEDSMNQAISQMTIAQQSNLLFVDTVALVIVGSIIVILWRAAFWK